MPKKFFKRKINNYRKKPFRRTMRKRLPMSRMPRQLIPDVKRIVDNTWTAETMDDYKTGASFLSAFTTCAEGNEYNQRDGDKIYSRSLSFNMHIEGSTSQPLTQCRIDFIEDNQPAANFPGFQEIYNTNAGALTPEDSMNIAINPGNLGRFRIRKSFKFPLRSVTSSSTSTAGGCKYIKFFVRTSKVLRYSSPAATQQTYGKRWILVGWSNLSANTPQVWCTAIHRYTDV